MSIPGLPYVFSDEDPTKRYFVHPNLPVVLEASMGLVVGPRWSFNEDTFVTTGREVPIPVWNPKSPIKRAGVVRGGDHEELEEKTYLGLWKATNFVRIGNFFSRKNRKTGIVTKEEKLTVKRLHSYRDNKSAYPEIPLTFLNLERRPYADLSSSGNLHFGQRKLLLSEIEFLTLAKRGNPNPKIVLYAGAAPGNHIPFLADMFPEVYWVLFDPLPFSINPSERIAIYNRVFTSQDIDVHSSHDGVYLISDIRNTPESSKKVEDYDAYVEEDNVLQQEWVRHPSVCASMIKHRLAFSKGLTSIPKGTPRIQAWARKGSTETRLISFFRHAPPGGDDIIAVDKTPIEFENIDQEEKMAYFNQVIRSKPVKDPRFGACYDLMREAKIIDSYLSLSRTNTRSLVADWISAIDAFLGGKVGLLIAV